MRGLHGDAAYAGAVAATAMTGTVHMAPRVTARRVGREGASVAVSCVMSGCPDGEHGSPQIQLMLQR